MKFRRSEGEWCCTFKPRGQPHGKGSEEAVPMVVNPLEWINCTLVTIAHSGLIIFLHLTRSPSHPPPSSSFFLEQFLHMHFPWTVWSLPPIYDMPLPGHYCTTYAHIRGLLMCTIVSPSPRICLIYHCTVCAHLPASLHVYDHAPCMRLSSISTGPFLLYSADSTSWAIK